MKILLVDDEPSFLEQAKISLKKKDERLDIDTASSAEEGLELLDENDYDAIVSDYQMPGMDGLEFLKTVRKDRVSDIPFIIFTGKGREEVAMDALNLGANRYLRKGGSPKSQYGILVDAINREVELHGLEQWLEFTSFSLDNADVGALWVSPHGRIRYANKRICQKLGYDQEEMRGMTISDIDPNYLDERPEIWEEIKEKGSVTFESQHRTKDGETLPVRITSHYLEKDGKEYEFAFVHDITDWKEAEEELKKRGKKFEELFEAAPDPAYLLDEGGTFQEVNEAFSQRTGYDKEEIVGKSLEDELPFLPEESREKTWENFKKRLKGEDIPPYSIEIRTKDGETLHGEINASPIKEDDEIVGEIGIARDITDLRRAEKRLEKLFRLTPDLVYILDEKGIYQDINPAHTEKVGYDREEIIGKQIRDTPFLTEESVKKIENRWGGDNSISVEESVRRVEEQLEREEIGQREREPYTIEYETKDGDTRYLEVVDFPLVEGGELKGFMGIARDITTQKEAEKREEFLHSLLRHDVRNKAQIVQGYLELAEEYDLSEEVEDYLSRSKEATEDAMDIIEKVRTLRKLSGERKTGEIELHSLIEEVIQKHENLFSSNDIELECSKEKVKVRGGPLLEELFSNLLENAVRHAECSNIRVDTEEGDREIVVIVEDDGKGISDSDKEKIFERGFKDEETGGSGLGLFLVKEIAESYGGSVEVKDSKLGGARFDVRLKKA